MTMRIMTGLTILLFAITVSYAEEPSSLVPPDLEKAVLAQDWEQIAKLLKEVDLHSSSPVKRLIKGHAYLAMNRNNDSFRLFATATPEDLSVWERWASGLAKVNPRNSSAHFYRADALARLEKHEEAIAAFTDAIESDANNAYALHGRGVLYAQLGKYNEAGKDLAAANLAAPDVADFHNSRGMLRIAQRKGNVVRLEQQFKRATALSKDFALAHHALGCIELLRNPDANIDSSALLRNAHDDLPEASLLFAANESDYERAVIEQLAFSIASAAGDANAGTAIRREVTLGKLAENYSIRKDALGGLRGLPRMGATLPSGLGGYGLKRTESQIVSEVKQMSPREAQDFATRNPRAAHSLADAIVSWQQSMPSKGKQTALQSLPGVARYIKGVSVVTPRVNVDLDMNAVRSTANNRARESSRSRLDLAVHVNRFRGSAVQYDRAEHGRGVTTPDSYKGTIQRFAPGPAIHAQPGGATTDRRVVVWGRTPWPFRPLFGLLYVPTVNAPLAATAQQSEGAAKVRVEP